MASVIQKQTLTIWCGTIGLATSLVVGCGSSKPPAPPVAAPAASAPAGGPMPMMASAPPGGHGAAPAQAPMHGQAPGGGHGMPTPGAPSSAHAGPGAHGAPSSAHAAGPSSASMTPEQMMANAGQAPTSGHGAPGPTSATPASMPAGHGQGAPGVPGQPNSPAAMAAGHGQGAPNTNMPMPLPGGGHNQPGANAAAMAAAGAAGAGGAHAGNPAAMLAPGGLAPGGLNPGAAGIAGGAAAASQFEPGSAEEALAKFCVAMADSNLTEAAEYISPKAKGLLAQIRDGSLSEEKTDELKESFSPQGLTNLKARQTGVGKAINLSNAKHELLSFTLMREADDAYFLREFKVSKLPTNLRTPGRSR